jgi:hypothetical protein
VLLVPLLLLLSTIVCTCNAGQPLHVFEPTAGSLLAFDQPKAELVIAVTASSAPNIAAAAAAAAVCLQGSCCK